MKHFLTRLEEVLRSGWDQPALTNYRGRSYTHKEVAQEIIRLHELFKALDIQPGDHIAIAARNSAQWAVTFLAAASWHTVTVPILADFTPDMIQTLTAHADCKLLFTDRKLFAGMHPENIAGLRAAIQIEDAEPLYTADEAASETIAAWQSAPAPSVTPDMIHFACDNLDELAVINYTSGTTGTPKGIMLPARSISANLEYSYQHIPCHAGETSISMLPLAHMYGLTVEFLYTFLGGCHLYFLGKTPTPTILMQALKDIRPFLIITVPLVLEKIVKNKVLPVLQHEPYNHLIKIPVLNTIIYRKTGNKIKEFFGGNVRSIPVGGAAMNSSIEKLLRRMRIPFTMGYGMTECGPLVSYINWRKTKPGCCGRAVSYLQLRVDSTDPAHVAGELQIKGDGVMTGYYKNPEATAAAFTDDGWLRTGDLGTISPSGDICIRGRSKCMILSSSGQNIYPEELESILNAMEHVLESLVLERDGRIVALVALNPDEAPELLPQAESVAEELRRTANKSLPAYSQIHKVEILPEGFVHTPKHSIKRCLYE